MAEYLKYEARQLVQWGSLYYSICFVHIYIFYNKKSKNKKIENYIFEDSYQINIPNSALCSVAFVKDNCNRPPEHLSPLE